MRTLALLTLVACSELPADTGQERDTSTEVPDPSEQPDDLGAWDDPFAARPDQTLGLTNVGTLAEVLEGGTLRGACDLWAASPGDAAARLRCGKAMFFYETFDTAGVPAPLVQFLLDETSVVVGPGFGAFGMIPDPTSEQGLPLGLAPSVEVDGIESVAFTCASCHFGRLADGRYAVGAPNHDYEYGKHNLAMAVLPMALSGGQVDALARESVAPLVDYINEHGLLIPFFMNLMPLLGTEIPDFPPEAQRHYAEWQPGTLDFAIAPLPIEDGVHVVSRIPPLFEIATAEQQARTGMLHAQLGVTGNVSSLEAFLRGFVDLGGGASSEWSEEDLAPLADYVRSLQRIPSPVTGQAGIERGERVFREAGCLECHSGAGGAGTRLFEPSEVGTDAAATYWLDPDLDGEPCCGVDVQGDPLTNALKAPRLLGLWTLQRFLHNGSVPSLEALLCLEDRLGNTTPAYSDAGHTYGCDLGIMDRRDLVTYLRAH